MYRAPLDPETLNSSRVEVEKNGVSLASSDEKGWTEYHAYVERLRKGIVGDNHVFLADTALPRQLVYTDYTASGRALQSVENFAQNMVLPLYGNTHTISSATARQTTYFRSEARQIVKSFYNCSPEDALIFCGSGATGATAMLVALLRKTHGFTSAASEREEDRWGSVRCIPCGVTFKTDKGYRAHCAEHDGEGSHTENVRKKRRTEGSHPSFAGCDILVDPLSHHSSILPFRALRDEKPTFYDVKNIALDLPSGVLCLADLERILGEATKKGRKCVAVLSAGSNVTGAAPPVKEVEELCALHDAVLCWDLAAVAGHHRFDFSPLSHFAFISPHKLLGGPGTPGILLAKKRFLRNETPCFVGGGVVHYVTPHSQQYIENLEDREEAGTPNIMGCIRAGLVYRVHALLDEARMVAEEKRLFYRLLNNIKTHANIEILGLPFIEAAESRDLPKNLPIVSFAIRFGSVYLHYNFVTVLLNDLFGVQVRGGCACAGPYAQMLLGMSPEVTQQYNDILSSSGLEVLRPGFVRSGVHFTMTDGDVDRIAEAVRWVASQGWKLLGAYKFDEETGEWQYRRKSVLDTKKTRRWISELTIDNDGICPSVLTESEITAAQSKTPEQLNTEADEFLDNVYSAGMVPISTIKDPLEMITAKHQGHVFFARPRDFVATILQFFGSDTTILRPGQSLSAADIPVVVEDGRISPFATQKTVVVLSTTPQAAPKQANPPKKGKASKGVPKALRSKLGEAVHKWDMIREGDSILVGLSGGKDSLSLLHCLLAAQRASPVKFTIAAATVNPMTPEYDPTPLQQYLKTLGVTYTILAQPLIDLAKEKLTDQRRPSICAFCARMKRGMLYSHMKEAGHNVLALGQHLDDMVESFLMSLFRNGALTTMKAAYEITEEGHGTDNNGLRVIRPLALVRERALAAYAQEAALPVIPDNCPACFAAPKERARVKVLLSQLEAENSQIFSSIYRAIEPLISVSHTDRSAQQQAKNDLLALNLPVPGTAAETPQETDMKAEEVLMPCGEGVCPA